MKALTLDPSRADHLGERFLADISDEGLRFSLFAEIGKQEEKSSQTLKGVSAGAVKCAGNPSICSTLKTV